jgi:cytochrome c553
VSTLPTDPKEPAAAGATFGTKAVAVIAATVVLAWGTSLIVLPIVQGGEQGFSAFGAICRALGLRPPSAPGTTVPGPSAVAWDAQALGVVLRGDAGRGEKLAADTCTSCHNPNGQSADPTKIPAIAGQSAHAIYKQLSDIKSGARTNPDMQPLLEKLDEAAFADLAAYYGSLPARNTDIRELVADDRHAVDLVTRGDAARALPPCGACHDVPGGPVDAPNLVGQFPNYVTTQLHAYATGTRRNDPFARMRTIAGKLTEPEIAALATYFNARH